MIISLRGTNGSGKSFLVQTLMKRFSWKVVERDDRDRPLVYRLTLGNGSSLYLVGPYDTPCGGCDAIQPYDRIWPIVDRYAEQGGHVLFEGSMVSSGYGRIGVASEKYGDDIVFVFLDTPPKKCVDHVVRRREARGNTKPLDPKNVYQKYYAVELSIINIGVNHGRSIFILNHRNPVPQLLGLLYRKIKPEDRSDPELYPKIGDLHRKSKSKR